MELLTGNISCLNERYDHRLHVFKSNQIASLRSLHIDLLRNGRDLIAHFIFDFCR